MTIPEWDPLGVLVSDYGPSHHEVSDSSLRVTWSIKSAKFWYTGTYNAWGQTPYKAGENKSSPK